MPEHGQAARLWLVALLALGATGCASVPFDYPRQESHARPIDRNTYLGEATFEWTDRHPGQSAFYPLQDGMDALGARLRLMERAEHTIDAQYFLIKDDRAGALFAGKMLRAADRGVRVRFLLDDVFTTDLDPELALLDAHPNIEVRMFNPLSRQGLKKIGFVFDFERANRRMHNKSFTVDGATTIVGGRNIAEEYFQIGDGVEFADFEVVGFGPVAADVSATFDLFWNSPRAVPMSALGGDVDAAGLDAMRARVTAEIDAGTHGIYEPAVNSELLKDIREGRIEPFAATATVVTDEPEKLDNPVEDPTHRLLIGAVADRADSATREAIFISPYFVPGDGGVAYFSAMAARGVRVVIITNSLASTNHVAVHSGYFYRRRALLEAGVEIYEMRAYVAGRPQEKRTLHGKIALIDRETLFVGSLNLDPRSVDINTEMGLFIESPEATARFASDLDDDLAPHTYRLALGADGAVEWHDDSGAVPVVERDEPQASWGRKFSVGLYQLLPIESQL